MTVPIQIPIIATSPPATTPVKPAVRPEKSGTFDQILKQKTCESIQGESGSDQSDQVVKNQPKNNIQTEEKPVKEEIKPDSQKETDPVSSEEKDPKKTDAVSQPLPNDTPAQVAAVPVVTTVPVSVEAYDQSSEKSVIGVEAAPLNVSGSSITDSTGPHAAIAVSNALSNGEQVAKSPVGNGAVGFQEDQKKSQQGKDSTPFSETAIDPSSQIDLEQQIAINAQDNSNGKEPYSQKAGEAIKVASGQSAQNVPAESIAPDQTMQVKAANPSLEVEGQNAEDSGATTSKSSAKSTIASDLFINAQEDIKVDAQVKSITGSGQAEGKMDMQPSPEEQIPAEARIRSVRSDSVAERKLDTQSPPEAPEPVSPTVSPGAMQERMRMDPFTGKINEPARLAEAQTTEILRQISRQVAGSSGTGSQSIHIQLHPEDLGQIDLRISTSTLGTHITLIPDQSSTGKLLETHIAELKQTLADAGVQMANVHVGQQSQQQSFRDPQYGQNIARQNSGYNPTAHDSVDEVPGARSLSRTSLVDYRI